jgi:multimeric flavodoxin WrbA
MEKAAPSPTRFSSAAVRTDAASRHSPHRKEYEIMTTRIHIVFYSMYGHIYRMAEAVAEGAREVAGAEVTIFQVPELVPDDVLEKSGAKAARQAFAHVPLIKPDQLGEADALIFGTGTRFGNMTAQMRNFLGSAFTSTASQHGGQETTLTSFHTTLLHQGMIIVGVPYAEQRLLDMSEVSGGTPYGASTITGGDGSRLPSENELAIARYQGRHVATIASQLKRGRA